MPPKRHDKAKRAAPAPPVHKSRIDLIDDMMSGAYFDPQRHQSASDVLAKLRRAYQTVSSIRTPEGNPWLDRLKPIRAQLYSILVAEQDAALEDHPLVDIRRKPLRQFQPEPLPRARLPFSNTHEQDDDDVPLVQLYQQPYIDVDADPEDTGILYAGTEKRLPDQLPEVAPILRRPRRQPEPVEYVEPDKDVRPQYKSKQQMAVDKSRHEYEDRKRRVARKLNDVKKQLHMLMKNYPLKKYALVRVVDAETGEVIDYLVDEMPEDTKQQLTVVEERYRRPRMENAPGVQYEDDVPLDEVEKQELRRMEQEEEDPFGVNLAF